MAGICSVIGVFSAIVGLTGFIEANMPHAAAKHEYDSVVRIAVGQNRRGPGTLKHAAGTAPAVVAYNNAYERIGETWTNPHISTGGWRDLVVRQEIGRYQQPVVLQIRATDDALCIAYISRHGQMGR